MRAGRTRALAGEPRELSGHGRERFVYATVAGVFRTRLDPGGAVHAGQTIGCIDGAPVRAPLGGWLRGIAHDAAVVREGAKIVEVDALGPPQRGLLGERPRRIADGVLRTLAGRV